MLFSTLAAGLLYGLYCLTLRRDRWLQLNLWYLLVAIGFSMVFPFIKLPDGLGQASQSVASVEEYLVTMNEVEISAITAPRTLGVMVDLYLVGVALCAVYLLFQLAAQVVIVIRLRRRHKVYRYKSQNEMYKKSRQFVRGRKRNVHFLSHTHKHTKGVAKWLQRLFYCRLNAV